MDDGPVAPRAVHSFSGPALDVACRALTTLATQPAIAGPAWWDANAPARRVTYVRRAGTALPPAPWPARRALDFCAELALALALIHEAGAAHGALRPAAVAMRPDGGPLIRAPAGAAGAEDDLHGLGIVLLSLLTGRTDHTRVLVEGEDGPAAEAAALLHGLLSPGSSARPPARGVAARLAEIAAAVEDTSPPPPRQRGRVVTALVLLVVAGAAGGYLVGHRVGPPGPTLSPTTVTVPATTLSP